MTSPCLTWWIRWQCFGRNSLNSKSNSYPWGISILLINLLLLLVPLPVIRAQPSGETIPDGEVIPKSRTVTTEEQNRIAAEVAEREAQQLVQQKTPESQTRAIAKYEEALQLWRTAGNRSKEAYILNRIASLYSSLSNLPKAIEYYNQALPIYRALGDNAKVANILYDMGLGYNLLGDKQKAVDSLLEARNIFKALGDRSGEGLALVNLGWLHYFFLGARPQALEFYNQALTVYRAAGNRSGESGVYSQLGWAYYGMGDNQKALEYYKQAISLAREVKDPSAEAHALLYISQVYEALNQKQEALESLNASRIIFEALGNRGEVARTFRHAGGVYWGFGQGKEALEAYDRSLSIYHSLGNRIEEGYVTRELGLLYNWLGNQEKALEFLNQSVSIRRAVGEVREEARTIYEIAGIKRKAGKLKEAISDMESVIAILESMRIKITNQELRSTFFASIQDVYQFYIHLLMELHKQNPSEGYDGKALQISERARARILLEMLAEAGADIRQGVEPALLERERALQKQLDDIEKQRVQLLQGNPTEAEKAEIEKAMADLLGQYRELQTQIRAKSPRYAAITQPQPLTLEQIQQQVLDDNTILLEYSLGEERSYLWMVTKTSITSYELPKSADIEAVAKELRVLLTDSEVSQNSELVAETSAKLSQIILAPVAEKLGQKRLVIVADGILQYMPFAALTKATTSKEYIPLIIDHEIVNLPSASMLAISRKELLGRTTAPKTIAVLADPVFGNNDDRLQAKSPSTNTDNLALNTLTRSASETNVSFNRLKFTAQEANAIIALISDPNQRQETMGFAADRTAATSSNLAQYRIVHFATHGIMNPTNPELSGLVMSLVDKDGNSANGFLRLNDIFNLQLSADLVVMSACQTATGKEVKGEGIVGLTRGFMYAGAARVMASLWSVNDPATSQLMTKFYQRYLKEGLPAAAALRAAQLEMFKQQEWHSPYYWAAFTLQGEWK